MKHRRGTSLAWLIFWFPWAVAMGMLIAKLLIAIHG
jgi:hypothetical protein